jgi:hypothetical protein
MSVSKEHKLIVRMFFYKVFGGKCLKCDNEEFDHMHFHHKNGSHLINGKDNTGRGSDARLWELFEAYLSDNLEMLCEDCHEDTDDYKGRVRKQ